MPSRIVVYNPKERNNGMLNSIRKKEGTGRTGQGRYYSSRSLYSKGKREPKKSMKNASRAQVQAQIGVYKWLMQNMEPSQTGNTKCKKETAIIKFKNRAAGGITRQNQ